MDGWKTIKANQTTFEVTAKDTGQCRDATRNVCGCLNGRRPGHSYVPAFSFIKYQMETKPFIVRQADVRKSYHERQLTFGRFLTPYGLRKVFNTTGRNYAPVNIPLLSPWYSVSILPGFCVDKNTTLTACTLFTTRSSTPYLWMKWKSPAGLAKLTGDCMR